jgi:pyruvate/2-oxoglutarate dehydrogenase complex dihydrolipoamide acyltransferase (E2) component
VTLTIREERPLSPMRRLIAERLGRHEREVVRVTLHRDVDVSALAFHRARRPDPPSVEDYVIRACALALQEHPSFNALVSDGVHRLAAEVNIGIAVQTERGLVVPVLKDAHRLGVGEIARRRRDLVDRTRSWRHRPEDLEEGTFTVTNLGPFGVDAFTPVINPPQVAILGIGRVRGEPPSAVMTLSLSFDHRVADGAEAATFLQAIARALTEPGLLDVTHDGTADPGDARALPGETPEPSR